MAGIGGQQAGLAQAAQGAQFNKHSTNRFRTSTRRCSWNKYFTFRSVGRTEPSATQAQLDATREATRMAAFQPQEQLNRFADQVTGIMGGMRGTGTNNKHT